MRSTNGTPSPGASVSHVTPPEPATVISETQVERLDREVGPEAPRRDRLFAAASAKGVPLRTILTIDAVVIVTWVVYRLLGRLREVILWILIAAFIALVLNPAVGFLQRHRFRRGTAVLAVMVVALLFFLGLLGLLGYPLVNALTHLAVRLPTMVDQVEKGHGWLAHTLQKFHLLSWVQKNAPKLKKAAANLGRPALNAGDGRGLHDPGLHHHRLPQLFMLLEAPKLKAGLLGTMSRRPPDHRGGCGPPGLPVGDLLRARDHRPVGAVRGGGGGHLVDPGRALRPDHRPVGGPGGDDPPGRGPDRRGPECAHRLPPFPFSRHRDGHRVRRDSSWSRTISSIPWS